MKRTTQKKNDEKSPKTCHNNGLNVCHIMTVNYDGSPLASCAYTYTRLLLLFRLR